MLYTGFWILKKNLERFPRNYFEEIQPGGALLLFKKFTDYVFVYSKKFGFYL